MAGGVRCGLGGVLAERKQGRGARSRTRVLMGLGSRTVVFVFNFVSLIKLTKYYFTFLFFSPLSLLNF